MKMFACIRVERSVLCGSFVGGGFRCSSSLFEDERKSRIPTAWQMEPLESTIPTLVVKA